MNDSELKLSVLDQSVIRQGEGAVEAVRETIDLARRADRLGYTRFWVSEHHNIPHLAGSTPEVLLVKLAEVTSRIRVGAGGIMLPNHSSLKVAENFRMLEVLFPGRIDLGIGRAPGGDRVTAYFLNPSNEFTDESFLRQLKELNAFFSDSAGTSYGPLIAIPQAPTSPTQWMLTSGGSSQLAGELGMGLALPRFINPTITPRAVETYKAHFTPSEHFPRPQAALALFVLCAESEEKAGQLRKALELVLLGMERGQLQRMLPYEEIKEYHFSEMDLERLSFHRNKIVSGTPEQVREQLTALARTFDVDEIIATTMTYSAEDRFRSFELLAGAFQLERVAPSGTA